ncbi:hypothetical protein HanRHA438_Chr11g0531471 [Helianthus annuus]|nr:hypothetical protein HanIR_Chr11g0559851 [Helianthus annuus]KAJ0873132.1 hypothetical protein HanRHA438_Chr11g0531471 [Helianthus annuus]
MSSTGGPPSFSATWRPGSNTSTSNNNTRTKPVSFQRSIEEQNKAPSIQDVDRRAKNSNTETVKEAGTTPKPASFGDATHPHVDNK